MTEDENKTKWCPKARPGAVAPSECGEVRGNREMDGRPDPGALCIGSACMAFRCIREEVSGFDADGFGYVRSEVTGGYCGLAGEPR